ncbi:MAG: hypothetical protein NC395_11855 [Prevotella sp.]|nr:hypothetical protein [Prevotella sp.]
MRAKFNSTKTVQNIIIALFLVTIAAMLIVGISQENNLLMFIPVGVFLVITYILIAFHGEIIADEKGITVVTTFLGIAVWKKFIKYGDVDRTDCGVETVGYRWDRVSHIMEFTIKMKGIKRITVSKRLNIGASFPAEQPEKYKQYLHEQPLMQISHYIDGKLHLNTSA